MNREEYFKQVINDVVDGKKKIRGDHPKDVKEAIDAFFHAGKMLLDTKLLMEMYYTEQFIKAMERGEIAEA